MNNQGKKAGSYSDPEGIAAMLLASEAPGPQKELVRRIIVGTVKELQLIGWKSPAEVAQLQAQLDAALAVLPPERRAALPVERRATVQDGGPL